MVLELKIQKPQYKNRMHVETAGVNGCLCECMSQHHLDISKGVAQEGCSMHLTNIHGTAIVLVNKVF